MDMNLPRMQQTPKYFYLRNVDVGIIDAKYDIKTELLVGSDYAFIDELKNNHKCIVIEPTKSKKCWWCRHDISQALYCPIKIMNDKKTSTYYSHSKKTSYMIRETDREGPVKFVVDGAYCSYNCCIAFINDSDRNPMYKDSMTLLHKYHYIQTGKVMNVEPAPHWRMLKDYGGNMDIETFRNNAMTSQIESHGLMVIPMGLLIEKKIKF
jgi:hypothetical protein